MKLFSYVRTKLGVLIVHIVRARYGVVIFYGDAIRRERLRFIASVRNETKLLLSDHEAYQILSLAYQTEKIPGAIAEVGVYRGASAKLIAHAAGKRPVYLFDTFDGLPPLEEIDRVAFSDGQYGASMEEVSAYLSAYPNATLIKGVFPQTAQNIENQQFSFVHLDVDLYKSTKEALEFFYPRMSKGGVIISHDYMTAPGVRKAVDDFMFNKPEAVFESSWRQCFIVKV